VFPAPKKWSSDDSSLGCVAYKWAKAVRDACRLTIKHSVLKTAKNTQR
jgi:hypothetical protein